jgi:hypothetical protein
MGLGALLSGHFSSIDSHYRHYATDGNAALVAGGILCACGLLFGLAAIFSDSELLNRPIGKRRRLP